ncbi:MAG: YiiD C-terminal domain-containing protein [Rudaea sp.]
MAKIPLTRAMQVAIRSFDGHELTLDAPLQPNVNDKGCAFGGSLVSLLTLAGWGLVLLRLEAQGLDCDIFVQDSTTHYREPLWSDLRAHARISGGDETWGGFVASLAARGRGRVRVACRVTTADGADACTLDARFVAIARARGDTR